MSVCLLAGRRVFKPILAQCYYQNGERDNYFVFELTKNEAKGLISKFEQNTIGTPAPQRLPAPSQVHIYLLPNNLTLANQLAGLAFRISGAQRARDRAAWLLSCQEIYTDTLSAARL